jgi:hypothetical protein
MLRPLIVVAMATSPALGDTFVERWPSPISVEPAPIVIAESTPRTESKKSIRHDPVCAKGRRYYTRHGWRYWRCRR